MTGAVAAMGPAGIIDYPDLQSEEVAAPYTMKTNGSITTGSDITGNLRWIENGAPTNYEVSFAGGAYQDFSADRTLGASGTIDLRDKWSTTVVKSVTVTLV